MHCLIKTAGSVVFKAISLCLSVHVFGEQRYAPRFGYERSSCGTRCEPLETGHQSLSDR